MSSVSNDREPRWLPEINCDIDEELFLTDIIEDDNLRMAELFDPLWDDFLSSGLNLEDALTTGYMDY